MIDAPLHLGVDIGTQGVRVVAADSSGRVRGRAARPLPLGSPDGHQEQSPALWWSATVSAIRELGEHRRHVVSLAISCTSGSVCAVDRNGDAIGPGLLYADRRARSMVGFDSSWAVAKIAGMIDDTAFPFVRVHHFTSPGGFVADRMVGEPTALDVTQALKFGFDPERNTWGPIPVDAALLPSVVATGDMIGTLCPAAAEVTGLDIGVELRAGATDGVAGQVACRPSPRRWSVAIGSTMVWKAMSDRRIDARERGIYSHRGPDGWWFPGAASMAGARVLSIWASQEELDRYDRDIHITPETAAMYPSVADRERFPFVASRLRLPAAIEPGGVRRYGAQLLGLAFVERWGCEALTTLGCPPPASIASTGGAVESVSLGRLRADVLGVPLEVVSESSSAFGAVVIAASSVHGGILRASDAMVTVDSVIEPDPAAIDRWHEPYRSFKEQVLTFTGEVEANR